MAKFWPSCAKHFCNKRKTFPNFSRDRQKTENLHKIIVLTLMESKNHLEFQRLWELVMIRSFSEAMCKTVGSIMGQHCAKSRYEDPDNFSKISI
jgi:hypothetical protein